MLYVLTCTSGRPAAFAACRESVQAQSAPVTHVVYSDDALDEYAVGDVLVRGPRLPIVPGLLFGPDFYKQTLLRELLELPSGWVTFLDDDDLFTRPDAAELILAAGSDPRELLVWKVQRENTIKPRRWQPRRLLSRAGRLCWENAAFHTTYLKRAIHLARLGSDTYFWYHLSRRLPIRWLDEVLFETQAGKGHGLTEDQAAETSSSTMLPK